MLYLTYNYQYIVYTKIYRMSEFFEISASHKFVIQQIVDMFMFWEPG